MSKRNQTNGSKEQKPPESPSDRSYRLLVQQFKAALERYRTMSVMVTIQPNGNIQMVGDTRAIAFVKANLKPPEVKPQRSVPPIMTGKRTKGGIILP